MFLLDFGFKAKPRFMYCLSIFVEFSQEEVFSIKRKASATGVLAVREPPAGVYHTNGWIFFGGRASSSSATLHHIRFNLRPLLSCSLHMNSNRTERIAQRSSSRSASG